MKDVLKENWLKILGAVILMVVLFTLGYFALNNSRDDKISKNDKETQEKAHANTNENIVKEQVIDNYKFSNTSLVMENGTSVFKTDVTNLQNVSRELKTFNIVLYDKNDKEIVTLLGYVASTLEANETKTVISNTDQDLTDAYYLKYVINK